MTKFVGNFTESMKNYTEEKLKKLKNRNIDPNDVRVKYERISEDFCTIEISVNNFFRAKKKGLTEDYYHVVLDVIDCIVSQADRYNKHNARKRNDSIAEEMEIIEVDETPIKYEISREKSLIVEEMTFETAVEEMEALGHNFYIYRDVDTGKNINVLYKRDNGTYGIIQCR